MKVDTALLEQAIAVLQALPSSGRRQALAALLRQYPEAAELLRRRS